mgnify:CR=1 FL=1
MFQLTKDEDEILKSQIATSSWGGKRKLPYAFTEQGIYMLATVLRGELAEQQSIFIMRAFREMRHYIRQNQQFVTQSEMHLISARVSEISAQMSNMADRQKKAEQDIRGIQKNIDTLSENFVSDKDFKNFVIYCNEHMFFATCLNDEMIGFIHAGTALRNVPSVVLLKRLGFELIGTEKVSFFEDESGNDIYFEGGNFLKNLTLDK